MAGDGDLGLGAQALGARRPCKALQRLSVGRRVRCRRRAPQGAGVKPGRRIVMGADTAGHSNGRDAQGGGHLYRQALHGASNTPNP